MRGQRVRAEDQPGLLALKNTVNERLYRRLNRRQLLRERIYRKVLHAEYLVDREPGEYFLMLDDQHPPLFAQRREFHSEIAAQIHDRQQATTNVRYALDPPLHTRKQGIPGLMENFANLAHGRHEQATTHSEPNPRPGLDSLLLRRQASRQSATTRVDFEKTLKR